MNYLPEKLTIDREGDGFVVDNPSASGSPPVGRGKTMLEAIGSWFHTNQDKLGLEFEVLPGARADEHQRRQKELDER